MHSKLVPVAAVSVLLAGCSRRPPQQSAIAERTAEPARITQLYTTTPSIARGEKGLLCYGVEHARSVWLSPPREELSAALSRCVEIAPQATTTYTLTAEGATGPPATMNLTVTVGAPHVKIVEVQFTKLALKRGEALGICYTVQNARSVEIAPAGFRAGADNHGCITEHPARTTTYVVTAIGAAGERDTEKATVTVR